MAIPLTAFIWDDPMDPSDVVDFIVDCADPDLPLLEAGETIASFTLTLPAESVALGLTIGTSTRAPAKINTDTAIKLWLSVDSGYIANAAFSGAGTSLPVEVTIVTSSTPSRTRQRTCVVKVAQR